MFYSDGVIRVAVNGATTNVPEGVTAITEAEFKALQPIPKNPEALLSWLYSNDDYLALMNSHGGIVAAFERQISENRYALALQLWNQLPVPQSLADQLFAPDGPLAANGYGDLIDFANADT